jgi:hypothetical protein
MFNILSVLVFLPLELVSNYLETVSAEIVGVTNSNATIPEWIQFLKLATEPLIDLIIQLDKEQLKKIGSNESFGNESLILHFCDKEPHKKCSKFT